MASVKPKARMWCAEHLACQVGVLEPHLNCSASNRISPHRAGNAGWAVQVGMATIVTLKNPLKSRVYSCTHCVAKGLDNGYTTLLTDWLDILLIVDCWPCLNATLQDDHLFNMPPTNSSFISMPFIVNHAYMQKVRQFPAITRGARNQRRTILG